MTDERSVDVDAIVASIQESRKYRTTCEDTIRHLVLAELAHHKSVKDAVKAARKKLHYVVAPYLGNPDYDAAEIVLQDAFQSGHADLIRETCADIMESHASTRERLSVVEDFYSQVFAITGMPNTLLDLACGLNPLSFPWMGLPISTRYHAFDIHERRVGFLNRYFLLQGLPPLAEVRDVLSRYPVRSADIALILKEVHRFERRQRGCSLPLLEALRVRYLVVSFPTRSLSKRRRLTGQYRRLFHSIIQGKPWNVTEIQFESELVFCVDKAGVMLVPPNEG